MALAASSIGRFATPKARLAALRRDVRFGAPLLALVIVGMWGLFAWHAAELRADTLERAQRELTLVAQAYAEYAAAAAVPDSVAPGAGPLDPLFDQARLATARAVLAPPAGVRLALWRFVDGAWLAGDRVAGATPATGPALPDEHRLVARAERPVFGVIATAERDRPEILQSWRRATRAELAGLGAFTVLTLVLAALLWRQRDRRAIADARWHALVDHTADGVFVIRVERAGDDPLFRYEAVNAAGVAFWSARRDAGELIGRDVRDVLPPETCDKLLAHYRTGVATGEPQHYEVTSPDGVTVREAVAVPVRDVDGAVTRLVITTRDVTEQRQRRRALDQALLRAGEASRAKSEFLANTSHELRTPLNAVIGYADLLSSGLAGPLDTKQADYVGIIHQSGQHLLHIICDILDLAKVETGRLDLQLERVMPREVVDSSATLVADRVTAGRLRLAIDCSTELPALQADATRLKQILVNLLSNAAKFTPRGGLIGLAVRRTPAGGVAFLVSDSGPGMTAAEIARALEMFGQVDGGLERRHDGTGLGLPLARRLTELHGGTLAIDSVKGRGTTVTVTLPPSCLADGEATPTAT
jgi:signal transduction histidine kinase